MAEFTCDLHNMGGLNCRRGDIEKINPLRPERGNKKTMETKYCHQCEKNLPLKHFNKNKKTKDGHSSPCKYCVSDKRKSHSPNVAKNIETSVDARKLTESLYPIVSVNCDYNDYTKTKLYQNQFFVAGDGGYQKYIDKINIVRG